MKRFAMLAVAAGLVAGCATSPGGAESGRSGNRPADGSASRWAPTAMGERLADLGVPEGASTDCQFGPPEARGEAVRQEGTPKPLRASGRVATIDSTNVSAERFNRALRRRVAPEDVPESMRASQVSELKRSLLVTVVDGVLLDREMERRGVETTHREILEKYRRYRVHFESDRELAKAMKRRETSPVELLGRLCRQGRSLKLVGRKAAPEIPKRKLRAYFRRHRRRFGHPPLADVSQVVVRATTGPEGESGKERAEELTERIRAGELEFERLVRRRAASDRSRPGPDLGRSGRLGWSPRPALPESLGRAIFSAEAGAVVGPVKTRHGYHVVKIHEIRPERDPSLSDVKGRVRQRVVSDILTRGLERLEGELRNERDIELHPENLETTVPVVGGKASGAREEPEGGDVQRRVEKKRKLVSYRRRLLETLAEHWQIPDSMSREAVERASGVVVVFVRLSESGHVVEHRFLKKSGIDEFDESIDRLLGTFEPEGEAALPLPEEPSLKRAVLKHGLRLQKWRVVGNGDAAGSDGRFDDRSGD